MFCKNCGNQMSENDKVCSSCGTPVAATEVYADAGAKNKGKKGKKTILVIGVAVVILILAFLLFGGSDTGSDLKDSTLPEYSEDITIEEAFAGFFEKPKWTTYEDGDQEVVVFNGYFDEESGDRIKVTMEMTSSDDTVTWEEVILYNVDSGDTTYLTELELEGLLNAVYENGTFSWYW